MSMPPHPADELAHLRREIRRLEAREAELRTGFLAGALPVVGGRHHVEVRTRTQRVFLRDRLPAAVLADPGLWGSQLIRAVVVFETPRAVRPIERHRR